MIAETSHPIDINISFNSIAPYVGNEDSIEIALCRRVMASYFDVPWETAQTITLRSVSLASALIFIANHHRRLFQIPPTTQIAFFLKVDEVNAIYNNKQVMGNLKVETS
jgi:hypothetical protein